MFCLFARDNDSSHVVNTFIIGLSLHNVTAVSRWPIMLCNCLSGESESMNSKHCNWSGMVMYVKMKLEVNTFGQVIFFVRHKQ